MFGGSHPRNAFGSLGEAYLNWQKESSRPTRAAILEKEYFSRLECLIVSQLEQTKPIPATE
jgi:hypothetical protein